MTEDRKSLYERLVEAGCETDSHQSDLYVRETEIAKQIIRDFESEGGITNKESFTSERDGQRWIDLPFAFKPFWDARSRVDTATEVEEDVTLGPRM